MLAENAMYTIQHIKTCHKSNIAPLCSYLWREHGIDNCSFVACSPVIVLRFVFCCPQFFEFVNLADAQGRALGAVMHLVVSDLSFLVLTTL